MKFRQEIEQSIAQTFGSGTWRRGTCYVCDVKEGTPDRKQSFGYNSDTGYFHCFRCGVKGFEKGAKPTARPVEPKEVPEFEAPEGYHGLAEPTYKTAMCTEPARQYLLSRGVGEKVWEEVGIGVAMDGFLAGRIIVPIKGYEGEWKGWQARVWTPTTTGLKYKNAKGMDRHTTFFNMQALQKETDEPLLVMEGTFDALPYWPYAVAVLGKPSHGQVSLLKQCKRPVVICLDGDAHIQAEMLCLNMRTAGKPDTYYVKLPAKEDPSTVDRDWLLSEAMRKVGKHG